MKHITVLKQEAVALLSLKPNSIVVDATYGAGGHALAICERLNKEGLYIGLDADQSALEESVLQSAKINPPYHLIHKNFADITEVVRSLHIKKVDAIIADLGWRTDQFTDGGKGFSFASDDPLLMTYGTGESYLFTAHDIVNGWAEEDIANVIYGYGEERYSRRIAQAIVTQRKTALIETASRLADIVAGAVPAAYRRGKTNPATKTFQALRIAVNDELQVLQKFLDQASEILSPEGVLVVISFHSLEDRIVKQAFRALASTGDYTILTKKPVVASSEELVANPRARSAKLRAIQKN
jgi:16S rRNA (cytosine1402-N4)-methyltransferase